MPEAGGALNADPAAGYLKNAARDSRFTEVPQGTTQFESWT
jgi:hypothetical protein